MAKKKPPDQSKLTPQRIEKIVDYVRKGNYVQVAAAAAGISARTYYDWRKRGAELLTKYEETGELPKDRKEKLYFRFAEQIAQAEAEAEANLVGDLYDHKFWQPRLEILQRRHAERWSQVQRQEISGPQGNPIQIAPAEIVNNPALQAKMKEIRLAMGEQRQLEASKEDIVDSTAEELDDNDN